MAEWILPFFSAFWLGILTSVSPCPLATNIAAISYVGRRVDKPSSVLTSGILYTCGRTLAYFIIGFLLVQSILSAPMLSHFLQKDMNMILGPLLIVAGVLLLGVIPLSLHSGRLNSFIQKKAESLGIWGSGFLGIAFALAFCPTSAALFFGSLLPLALSHGSGIALPAVYGIATGIPVLFFAVLLATGTNKLAGAYNKVTEYEKWIRIATGIIFILVGIYYVLTYIFGINFSGM